MTRMERKQRRINIALNISIVVGIIVAVIMAVSLFGEMKATYAVYKDTQETLERSQEYRHATELWLEQRASERGVAE